MWEYGIVFQPTVSLRFFNTGPPGQSTSDSRYRFGSTRAIITVRVNEDDRTLAVIRTLVELS